MGAGGGNGGGGRERGAGGGDPEGSHGGAACLRPREGCGWPAAPGRDPGGGQLRGALIDGSDGGRANAKGRGSGPRGLRRTRAEGGCRRGICRRAAVAYAPSRVLCARRRAARARCWAKVAAALRRPAARGKRAGPSRGIRRLSVCRCGVLMRACVSCAPRQLSPRPPGVRAPGAVWRGAGFENVRNDPVDAGAAGFVPSAYTAEAGLLR